MRKVKSLQDQKVWIRSTSASSQNSNVDHSILFITILNRKKERKDIFEDDEDYEEYEGFLPLRARRKARCLTTETVRIDGAKFDI